MDDDATVTAQSQSGPVGAVDDLAGLFGPSQAGGSIQQSPPFGAQQPKASNADILSMFGQPAPGPAMGSQLQQPQPRPMGPGYGSYSSASSANGGGMGGVQGQQWPGVQPGVQGYQTPMGGQIMLPGTPQNQMKGLTLGAGGSRTGTPSHSIVPIPAQAPTTSAAPAAPAQKDPFADLAGLF